MEKHYLSADDYLRDSWRLAAAVKASGWQPDILIALWRGGAPVGIAHDRGKTILLSTHDLEPAFRLADRLWLLTPGGLQTGTPRALAADGTLARYFAADGIAFDSEQLRFVY